MKINIQESAGITCKGRVYRTKINMFLGVGGSIHRNIEFELMKNLSCSGCEYCGNIDDILKAGITKEDAIKLRDMNWMIDEDTDSLACFV